MSSQKSRNRLGRGLSSLIGLPDESSPVVPVQAEITTPLRPAPIERVSSPLEIPLDQISANPHQPRRDFDEASLAELAASIKSNGVIQPIVVRKTPEGYQLIAGERRLRASKIAGLPTIPAIIRDVDQLSQAQMALVENIQREDLNPIDRAEGYRVLITELGLTQAELATRLGEDRSTISNHLRLLELAQPVRELLRHDKLSLGHAKVLAGVGNEREQLRLAELVVDQGLSVRNLERILNQPGSAPPRVPERPAQSAHLRELEASLSRQLGVRSEIRSGANKKSGKLVLHYSTLDEFDILISRLGVKLDE